MDDKATNSPLARSFLWLGLTVTLFFILYSGQTLIIPLILAVFIWYLINALSFAIRKIKIHNRSLPAPFRYIASVAIIVVILSIFFNLITQNVSAVVRVAPQYQAKIGPLLDKVYSWFPFEEPPPIREFVGQFDFANMIRDVAAALGTLAGSAGLISIYVIFLFLEQRSFNPKIKAITSSNIHENEVAKIIEEIDKDTRTYIGVKTLTSLTTGFISWGIMAMVGLDFATFWGMLIFFFKLYRDDRLDSRDRFPVSPSPDPVRKPIANYRCDWRHYSHPDDDRRLSRASLAWKLTEFKSPGYPPITRPVGLPMGNSRHVPLCADYRNSGDYPVPFPANATHSHSTLWGWKRSRA